MIAIRQLLTGAALLTIVGCATTPANMGILAGQDRLASAYKDKNMVDRGQADLAAADTALTGAQDAWNRGKKELAEHRLAMAETSLDLAATRGLQAKAEQDTSDLRNKAALNSSQSKLDATQAELNSKQMALSGAQQQLAGREQELRDAQARMQAYEMKETELGSTLVLRDVAFETGKSALRAGAANRLDPMIAYLRLNTAIRVRIEGHTDNVGGQAYNRQLSLDRANAVKLALVSGGVDPSRAETVGSDFSKPVGSNATVSGREANRRVEITLLR
jgi:outer membrane protein OmpA-like peptidoglycan-associated protein